MTQTDQDSKKEQADFTTQLLKLRVLTERFGVIHQAQRLNLQLWPFTIDPELEKSEAHVDIENHSVNFLWIANHSKGWVPDEAYRFRLQELGKSIALMLGNTWTFTIKVNGVAIFPVVNNGNRTRIRNGRKARGRGSNSSKPAGKARK
jgi:hypothetical protein